MWWYDKYTGQSHGRVLHGLEVFCGYHVIESASIGSCDIVIKGECERISFCWEKDNTPYFFFKNPDYQKKQDLLSKYVDDFQKAEHAEYAVQCLMENITLMDWESINYFQAEKLNFPTIEKKYTSILNNACYPHSWTKEDLTNFIKYIKKYKVV